MSDQARSRPRLRPAAITWGNRPHLDGLRMVAVYAVVAYHAGLGRAIGGFVGVDLFFVLSGFLVTMVLLQDLAGHGTIRLARFYARRARRLVPAAALAVIGTAAAGVLVSSSLDRSTMVGDAQASSLWFANWHFLREARDYFNVDGPESPFIHFWSLSIEEQFYIGFPLVVLLAWFLTRRFWVLASIASITLVASLILQLRWAPIDVDRAYLGTDTRIYQILAGSLLAMLLWRWDIAGALKRRRLSILPRSAALGALCTFAVIASSAVDISVSSRGIAAAAVSVALICSLEVSGDSLVAQGLALQPLRYLGQISYGTYLWHWPVLVLALTIVEMSPRAAFVVAAVLGTGLAALSAELVERPIRFGRVLDRAPRLAILSGVLVAVVTGLVVGPTLLESDRRPAVTARSTGSTDVFSVAGTSQPIPDKDWEAIAKAVPEVPKCEQPDGTDCFLSAGSSGTLLVIGDSHARMLVPAFMRVAADHDLSLAVDFSEGCPWQHYLLGEPGGERTVRCEPRRELTYGARIEELDPVGIVVAGFPNSIETRGGMSSPRADWNELSRSELVARATSESIDVLSERAPLLVIEPLPLLKSNPLSCLAASTTIDQCVIASWNEGIEESTERQEASVRDRVATLDLDAATCPQKPACQPMLDGHVVRRDGDHLTIEFASTLAPLITKSLDDLFSAADPYAS